MKPKDILPYLYKAVRNREHHQQVKLNCGTACCVAGDVVISHFPELMPYLPKNKMGEDLDIADTVGYPCKGALLAWRKPLTYCRETFELGTEISDLVFQSRSTVFSHLLAIFLVESDLSDLFSCWQKNPDIKIYNSLNPPFNWLCINGSDKYTYLTIQALLNNLCLDNHVTISPELQALLDDVEKFVPC